LALALSLPAFLLPASVAAQQKTSTQLEAMFLKRTLTHSGVTVSYRLYVPTGYNPAVKYPIVVALHGIGERGSDNSIQLTREELAQPWVRDSVQSKYPHFVMVPQCPTNLLWWPSNTWDGNRSAPNMAIVGILDSLKREYSLDTTRFYAVGLSMGGFGTIELMKWNPTLFAAAVPTAGGGDTAAGAIAQLIKTPMWAFHSATDPTVNVDRGSRTLVTKMEGLLGKPIVRFVSDTGMKNPTAISVDSLRKAVYVDKANFLYSEVRNVPGSGNTLHQAGWFAAWRSPFLTDWLFSKQKVNGATALSPTLSASRPEFRASGRLVLRGNHLVLERKSAEGRVSLHTLEGKLFAEE
jgi:predicted peptidase